MSRGDKIQSMATKAVNRLLGGKISKMPLVQQVKLTRAFMYTRPQGMETTRANLLKDDGLPEDIRNWRDTGMSRDEVKAFYWGCEEFQRFWTLDLKMEEATLDELIRGVYEPS